MEFNVNSPVLFVAVGAILAVVIAQSVFFLVRAYRRGVELGIGRKKLNGVIKSAAIFTVAPAVGIFIGVITLSKKLGIALPWLRLSVIGSLSYELTAAEISASAVGNSLAESGVPFTASQFVTIAIVMTLGIAASLFLAPLLGKKVSGGVLKIQNKDPRWGEIFMTSLFMGMISTFLGIIVCNIGFVKPEGSPIYFNFTLQALIPVFVLFTSAAIMALCGLLIKKTKWTWLEDYALPISMIGSMAFAIPLTAWIV